MTGGSAWLRGVGCQAEGFYLKGVGGPKNLGVPEGLSGIVCIHACDQLAENGGWGVGGGQVAQTPVFAHGCIKLYTVCISLIRFYLVWYGKRYWLMQTCMA